MHSLKAPRSLALAAAVLLAACSDTGDVTRSEARLPDAAPELSIALTCTASVEAMDIRCGEASHPGGPSRVLLGGQNMYVRLSSSNGQVLEDTFAIDVTVTNLIVQPLGTTDGSTVHPEGVRVFFMDGPASTSGGSVSVANPDGTGTFTGAAQPYFQYDEMLDMNVPSAAKQWKFQLAGGATTFTFTVLVSTAVIYPQGYILANPYVLTLDPGESRALSAMVYTYRSDGIPGAPITWTSSNPGIVTVSGSQATAGGARGFAEITLDSEGRPATVSTAVSVCPATVVTGGTSLPSSISSSDCFSSFGSNQLRPSTSYYGDLYRVALTEGQTITITLDSGDDLDTYLVLASPELGQPVAANDDDDEGVLGVGSRIVFTAGVTGVWVIEASTFNVLDQGSYTLGIEIN
jgi:hypothetical protein